MSTRTDTPFALKTLFRAPMYVAEAVTTNEGVYDLLASREKHCALDCGAAGYPITARLAAEIIGVFASEAMEAILPTLALRVRAVELHDREKGGGGAVDTAPADAENVRSEEHTSELQSLMRISYAVVYLK